jgi:hypothetical protein
VMKLVSSGRTTASELQSLPAQPSLQNGFHRSTETAHSRPIPATHDPQHGRQRTPLRQARQARDVVTAKAARVAKRRRYLNARPRSETTIFGSIPHSAAIAAECPWLRFHCPACRQIGGGDLRKLERRRGATIESLIPALSCRRCSPARHHHTDLKPRLPRGPRVSTPPIVRTIR